MMKRLNIVDKYLKQNHTEINTIVAKSTIPLTTLRNALMSKDRSLDRQSVKILRAVARGVNKTPSTVLNSLLELQIEENLKQKESKKLAEYKKYLGLMYKIVKHFNDVDILNNKKMLLTKFYDLNAKRIDFYNKNSEELAYFATRDGNDSELQEGYEDYKFYSDQDKIQSFHIGLKNLPKKQSNSLTVYFVFNQDDIDVAINCILDNYEKIKTLLSVNDISKLDSDFADKTLRQRLLLEMLLHQVIVEKDSVYDISTISGFVKQVLAIKDFLYGSLSKYGLAFATFRDNGSIITLADGYLSDWIKPFGRNVNPNPNSIFASIYLTMPNKRTIDISNAVASFNRIFRFDQYSDWDKFVTEEEYQNFINEDKK